MHKQKKAWNKFLLFSISTLFFSLGFAAPDGVPKCHVAIQSDATFNLSFQSKIAMTQAKLAEWLERRKGGLTSRKEREKRDTLFLIHKGIPNFLKPQNPKGITFRHYFSSYEALNNFLRDPKLIAGATPYIKQPLDNRAKQFESDTYEDLTGIFLTTQTQKVSVVGVISDIWVDVRLDESVGMAVLPSDDNKYTTFLIPAAAGFDLPVLEVVATSLDVKEPE